LQPRFRKNPTKKPGSGTLPAILSRRSRDGNGQGDRKQGRPPAVHFGVGTLSAQSSGLAERSGDRSKPEIPNGLGSETRFGAPQFTLTMRMQSHRSDNRTEFIAPVCPVLNMRDKNPPPRYARLRAFGRAGRECPTRDLVTVVRLPMVARIFAIAEVLPRHPRRCQQIAILVDNDDRGDTLRGSLPGRRRAAKARGMQRPSIPGVASVLIEPERCLLTRTGTHVASRAPQALARKS
jgi:hypothetical protein